MNVCSHSPAVTCGCTRYLQKHCEMHREDIIKVAMTEIREGGNRIKKLIYNQTRTGDIA